MPCAYSSHIWTCDDLVKMRTTHKQNTRGIRISDAAFLKREVGKDILPAECLFHILITLFTLRILQYIHFHTHSLIFSQRRNEKCLENFLEWRLP